MKRAPLAFPLTAVFSLALLAFAAPLVPVWAAEPPSPSPAMNPSPNPSPPVVQTLETAARDLLMPSETDAPFRAFFVPLPDAQNLEPVQLGQLAGAPDGTDVETRELDAFFAPATQVAKWMNADERAQAARFAALLQTIKTNLSEPQVVLWGDAQKQAAIIGRVEGGLAGLLTLVVET